MPMLLRRVARYTPVCPPVPHVAVDPEEDLELSPVVVVVVVVDVGEEGVVMMTRMIGRIVPVVLPPSKRPGDPLESPPESIEDPRNPRV
jgi:hypothetical protein